MIQEKGNFVTNLWDADDVGATPSTVPRRWVRALMFGLLGDVYGFRSCLQ